MPGFEDLNVAEGRRIVNESLQFRGGGWLPVADCRKLLDAFGIRQAAGEVAGTHDEAERLAERIGFPVAVKLSAEKVLHKTEAGGVQLNVRDRAAVREAFDAVRAADPSGGVLVQEMVLKAVELMIGVAEDPSFGPLIAFGLGGIHVEILGDVRFRVMSLTDKDACEMVREIRGYKLLEGYRGHPPADLAAIEEVLLRVSRMVEELPQIRELDLNPIFALAPGEGCRVADVRIRVEN